MSSVALVLVFLAPQVDLCQMTDVGRDCSQAGSLILPGRKFLYQPLEGTITSSVGLTAVTVTQPSGCGDFGAVLQDDGRCHLTITFSPQWDGMDCQQNSKDGREEVDCSWEPRP